MAIFLNSQKGSMNSLATQSGQYASNMERAANASNSQKTAFERGELGATNTTTISTGMPIDQDIREKIQGRGGFRSPEELVSALVEAQKERNSNKVIAERRAAQRAEQAQRLAEYNTIMDPRASGSVTSRIKQLQNRQVQHQQVQHKQVQHKQVAYAQGGFVNKPHIGMVGEGGPEYIILRNQLHDGCPWSGCNPPLR
jgi:hypothetical protein